jgi:hypothetical protein
MNHRLVCSVVLSLVLVLAGCAGGRPVPAWQGDAHDAQQLAMSAELEGNTRIAEVEWRRARQALASTAQPAWVARLELSRCAVQQAALSMQVCAPFEALQQDATPQEQSYHRYLAAQHSAADVALLPLAHQAMARAVLSRQAGEGAALLVAIEDPVSRLVAASVLMRAGLADDAVHQIAVDTAAEQGWRRPLLAWLTLQGQAARQAGQESLAQQIERRRTLLLP